MMRIRGIASLAAAGTFVLAGCSDSTGPEGTSVSLSFSATGGTPLAAPGAGAAETTAGYSLSDGQNDLVITGAEVVLREIEVKRQEDDDCATGDCEKFEAGPIVLDVPLDGATRQSIAVDLPPAIYDEVEFEIHKVSDDPEDDAVRQSHPHLDGQSIQVVGTWNGADFTYRTDLDVEQEFDLNPPLVVDDTVVQTNVTVRLDLSQWFRDGAGALLDPATANKGGVNEGLVKENIKQSIEAFEDEDRDGDDLDEDSDED